VGVAAHARFALHRAAIAAAAEKLVVTNESSAPVVLSVHTLDGAVVKTMLVEPGTQVCAIPGLATGMYVVRFGNRQKRLGMGQLLFR
jgi:hypothetical protein